MLGKSDTYISHIENGRMDIPEGPKLEALLEIYGPIKVRSFKERVRLYKHETSKLEVLEQLAAKLSDEKLEVLINITKQLINQPLVRRP